MYVNGKIDSETLNAKLEELKTAIENIGGADYSEVLAEIKSSIDEISSSIQNITDYSAVFKGIQTAIENIGGGGKTEYISFFGANVFSQLSGVLVGEISLNSATIN